MAGDAARQELEQLQEQRRKRTVTKEWAVTVAVNDQSAADPVPAASGAHDQIPSPREGERAGAVSALEDDVASVSAGEESSAIREELAVMVERGGQTSKWSPGRVGHVPVLPDDSMFVKAFFGRDIRAA